MYEWVGIVATVFVLIAFMFPEEKQIRIADAIGAMIFIIYGWLIGSFSVVIMNIVLVIIQAYHLIIKPRKRNK